MAFDWQDYFELAKSLQENPVTDLEEASKRTVVCRAYYAAYHIAINYALKSKSPPKLQFNGGDQGMIIDYFRKQTKMNNISSLLFDLREWRTLCDYKDSVSNLDILVQNSIIRAQKVVDLLTS